MKILKLSFLNINSLRGVHCINFTKKPFVNTGIFAITGATGSGKSTILDAITLALFNQTPRTGKLSKSEISTHGSIITNSTSEAMAEIEYEVKGKVYRSKWEIHKASKSGNLQDYAMEISDAQGTILDVKKSLVPDKNAELIGLNFEQFSKSMLLSQGEFAKFLKAGVDERSALLEKITGTDIYRQIGKAAFNRQKSEKEKLDLLKLSIQNIELLGEIEEDKYKIEAKNIEDLLPQSIAAETKLRDTILVKKKISTLESEKEIIEKKLLQVDIDTQNLVPFVEKLKFHQKVLPLKPKIDLLIRLETENQTQKIEIESLEEKEQELAGQKELFENDCETKEQQINELIFDYTQRQKNIIKKIKELNSTCLLNKESLLNTQNEKDKKQQVAKVLTEENEQNKAQIEAFEKKQKDLEIFLAENKILGKLPELLPLIAERQSAAQLANRQAKEYIASISDVTIKNNSSADNFIQNYIVFFNKQISFNQTEIEELSSKKGDADTTDETLIEERAQLGNKYNALRDIAQKRTEITQNKAEIISLQTKILQWKNTTEKQQQKAEKTQNEINIKTLKINELRLKRERQLLESKFKDFRLNLKKDEPCFLCGSIHHPYKSHYHENTDNLEQKIIEIDKEIKGYSYIFTKLQKEITSLQANIQNAIAKKAELEMKNISLTDKFNSISKNSKLNCSLENPDSIAKCKDKLLSRGEDIKNILDTRKKVNRLKIQTADYKNGLEKAITAQKKELYFKELTEPYRNYIPSETNILSALKQHSLNFIETSQQLTIISQQISDLQTLYKSNTKQLNNILCEITDLNSIENDKKEELQFIENEILIRFQEIFQGKEERTFASVEMVENYIQTKIKTQEKYVADQKIKLATVYESLKNTSQQLENLINLHSHNILEINTLKEYLLPKFQLLNITNSQEAAKKILSEQEVTNLQQRIKTNEDLATETKRKLNEIIKNKTQLSNNIDTQTTTDELEKRLTEITGLITKNNKRLGEIHALLDTELLKKEKIELLQNKSSFQEKEFEKWYNLNVLIGDSEGKKYTKFAQGLTLLQLIALANKHLLKLYPRYQIKEKYAEKEIVIVDTYLADSERSVKTLSGGESFMTSLALALGLSDLAGKNTNIDSLFIDEGFGTLDPDALDTALTALENLQAQTNRTIGIISHVQALKDRIPVQIRMEKSGTGYSKYTIYDGAFPVLTS